MKDIYQKYIRKSPYIEGNVKKYGCGPAVGLKSMKNQIPINQKQFKITSSNYNILMTDKTCFCCLKVKQNLQVCFQCSKNVCENCYIICWKCNHLICKFEQNQTNGHNC